MIDPAPCDQQLSPVGSTLLQDRFFSRFLPHASSPDLAPAQSISPPPKSRIRFLAGSAPHFFHRPTLAFRAALHVAFPSPAAIQWWLHLEITFFFFPPRQFHVLHGSFPPVCFSLGGRSFLGPGVLPSPPTFSLLPLFFRMMRMFGPVLMGHPRWRLLLFPSVPSPPTVVQTWSSSFS